MTAMLLLLMVADPSGLSEAFQTADRLEIWDAHRRKLAAVPHADLKRLAKRIKCDGDARTFEPTGGAIAAAFFYELRLLDKDGKVIGKFTLINNEIQFDRKIVQLANRDFQDAIRECFEGPRPKLAFRPKVVDQPITGIHPIALGRIAEGSMVFAIEQRGNGLLVFTTGQPPDRLTRRKDAVHEKLVGPCYIMATDRFVYVAGNSGIAGFRRARSNEIAFEASEFGSRSQFTAD